MTYELSGVGWWRWKCGERSRLVTLGVGYVNLALLMPPAVGPLILGYVFISKSLLCVSSLPYLMRAVKTPDLSSRSLSILPANLSRFSYMPYRARDLLLQVDSYSPLGKHTFYTHHFSLYLFLLVYVHGFLSKLGVTY